VETFLAGGVPDLITEYAVFKAAFLCEECSANCRLFVDLEFVVDLSRLVDGKERSMVRWETTYEAKDDGRFANGSFAWAITPVSVTWESRANPEMALILEIETYRVEQA
jgi:hypothetical protein